MATNILPSWVTPNTRLVSFESTNYGRRIRLDGTLIIKRVTKTSAWVGRVGQEYEARYVANNVGDLVPFDKWANVSLVVPVTDPRVAGWQARVAAQNAENGATVAWAEYEKHHTAVAAQAVIDALEAVIEAQAIAQRITSEK